jgi:hypothetical protein
MSHIATTPLGFKIHQAMEDGTITRPEVQGLLTFAERDGLTDDDFFELRALASAVTEPYACTEAVGETCEDPLVYADNAAKLELTGFIDWHDPRPDFE